MIGFLAPMALAGLALLAVPVLVHLFKPKRVRVVPFSSLRWLRVSRHRLSRRIQWHQVVLFLLRAGVVTALVMAAARPFFAGRGGAGRADRFVIVDVGRGMNYASADRARPIEQARALAAKLVAGGGPGDRTTVLLAGGAPDAFGPLVPDPDAYETRAGEVRAAGAEEPVSSALQLNPALLGERREDRALELHVVTANLSASWVQRDVAAFMREVSSPVRVQVLDVGPPEPRNAWIASARVIESEQGGPRTVRAELGAAGKQVQTRRLRLSAVSGMPDAVRDVAIEPGRAARVEFEIPPAVDLAEQIALLALEPSDALPDDDRYWLDLQPRGALRLLVVEPEATQVTELQPAFHLRAALGALREAEPGRLGVTYRTARDVRARDVEEADVALLVETPALTDEVVAALVEQVAAGGGLAVFLGPAADVEFHNTRLFDPLRPSSSLLTRQAGPLVDGRRAGALARLANVRWEHPLLDGLDDPVYGDLAGAAFTGYRRLEAGPAAREERILAAFADGTPAMIESRLGAGGVVLFNTTANDAWSDIPRGRSFVPLIDRLIDHLGGGVGGRALTVGEPGLVPLPRGVEPGTVELLDPLGRAARASAGVVAGRPVLRVEAPAVAGVYERRYRGGEGAVRRRLVVQAGRRQSPLARMDEAALRRWWEPAACEVVQPAPDGGGWRMPSRSGLLDPWLMVLAVLLLAGETLLAYRLCPRAAPDVVSDSLVTRRGFFKPGQDGGAPAEGGTAWRGPSSPYGRRA